MKSVLLLWVAGQLIEWAEVAVSRAEKWDEPAEEVWWEAAPMGVESQSPRGDSGASWMVTVALSQGATKRRAKAAEVHSFVGPRPEAWEVHLNWFQAGLGHG